MTEADLKQVAAGQAGDFDPEQKRYLEGFVAGVQIAKTARSVAGAVAAASPAAATPVEPTGPDAAALKAQNRTLASGGKLSDQEKFKREEHPFDTYERLKAHAAKNEYPKPADNFRWRFFGLFYVAPNQNSYMCRLRIPNGILKAAQFAGIADLAERYGGGYAHVTTRANIQIREVEAGNAVAVIEAVQDLGLCSRGSGADNIRNVTGTPTAGIDPQELIDTRPYAREWHFHILNDRSLYGLPRKFNVAFDGAGTIPVLEDTNDIGFQAVRVNEGFGLAPGVWFKLCLGGITGHRDFARDTGVLVEPQDACRVADAVVRLYVEHGNRTDRTKARLKYVLDAMGVEKFVALVEEKLGRKLDRALPGAVAPRADFDRTGHIGIHAQKQAGLNWIGVVLPVGRMSVEQMQRSCRDRQHARRRRFAAHRLAELADLRRANREAAGSAGAHRSARPRHHDQCHPLRSRRLHRQYRLQIRRFRHQASRRGHCALVRDARGARYAGQHPSDRLPSFLRAAFRFRDRAPRLQGPGGRGRGSGRGLSRAGRRRLRAECRARTRALSRRYRGERAAHRRADLEGLSRASRLARGDIPRLRSPARDRRAQGDDRSGGRRMSMTPRPPIPSFIPESAPFTPEQRTWLNGLLAGLFGLQESITPLSTAEAAKLLPGLLEAPAAPADEEDGAPWHDPAMPLPERMKLAEAKPLPRRLMAAMGQQDCGQCGYNCKEYADALFAKSEKRLNLCVPGGKDTARMLKELYRELDGAPATLPAQAVPALAKPAPVSPLGRSRDNPVYASFLSRRRLNKPGSEKETWHIDIDLAGTDLDYVVGDSFGMFPANDQDLVAAVLAAIEAPPDFPIAERTLREVLTDGVSLSPAPDMLFQLISYLTGGERRQMAKRLAAGEDPDGDAATLDVLAALHKFPGVRPDPEAFIEALDPLQPRLYSISSSPKTNPTRISLTVDSVRYEVDKRTRFGVCSTFLGNRIAPGDRIRVYVQKAPHFALPDDPAKPIIMIGPGTGIAPFRAFLHERQAINAPGRNWLFFGHQRSGYDFFYEDELVIVPADARLVAGQRPEDLRPAPHARGRPRLLVLAQ